MPTTITTIYRITGMTCQHCAGAVTKELSYVSGVQTVEVDLGAGTAQVTSDGELSLDAVRNAVTEAGCELADAHG